MSITTQLTTPQLQQLDRQHFLHPFTDSQSLAEQGTRVISHADGIYVWDSEGQQLLDGMSGLWCCNLGYGRKEISQAITQQLETLPFYNSFFQCTTPAPILLAERLTQMAPAQMNHVFYTNSGSEANDTVVRMIQRYWQLMEQPQRCHIIGRNNGYHGSTIAGASLGGMGFMHAQFSGLPNIHHVRQPYWYAEGGDSDPEVFGREVAADLEHKILQLGPETVAAFIAEPVQGAGGIIIPPSSYWPEVQRICREYGILLVADEVICGFGRTGKLFGADYYGIEADFMPFAKAVTNGYIPLGGVLVADRVAQVLTEQGGEFAHGFTYSGHPVACAAAIATLQLLDQEQLVSQVATETGPYLQQRWAELADHPLVGEARGLGLFAAIELVEDKASRQRFAGNRAGALCRDEVTKAGLIMRAVGDTMVIAPPLIISKTQIDELVAKAWQALDATQQRLMAGESLR